MTIDEIAERASEQLHAAYWSACDEQRRAIDPGDLTDEAWAVELLSEAYDIAMRVESDPLGWSEGRAKF